MPLPRLRGPKRLQDLDPLPRLKNPYVLVEFPKTLDRYWRLCYLCEDDINACVRETPKGKVVLRACGNDLLCDCVRTDQGPLKTIVATWDVDDGKKAQNAYLAYMEGWEHQRVAHEIAAAVQARSGNLQLAFASAVGPVGHDWVEYAAREWNIREEDIPY